MYKPFSSQGREAGGPWRISWTLLLLVLLVLVPPAAAAEYGSTTFPGYLEQVHIYGENVDTFSHDADAEQMKIALIYFTVSTGTQVDFTLYYGNGSTVSGYATNTHINPLQTITTVSLNGVISNYTYVDVNYFYDIEVAGYARVTNDTTQGGFLVSSDAYGLLDNNLAVFYPVDDLQRNLIYKVEAHSTGGPFTIEVVDGEPSLVAEGVAKTTTQAIYEMVAFALSMITLVLDLGIGTLVWLKFFFVDNLVMTISLYLGITMAFAAGRAKTIDGFFRKFFSDQKKLYEFILGLWDILISIIGSFRNIFRL